MRRLRPSAALTALLVLGLALGGCSTGGGGRRGALAKGSTSAPSAAARPTSNGGYGPPVLLGTVTDPDIDESSGLVASRRNPGLYWTHNDSGDGPYIYCLDGHGASCGTWKVPGASAFDWEDIAEGPGPDAGSAVPYLYLGDIGDNLATRSGVVVYRTPEPAATAGVAGPPKSDPGTTATAEAIRLRYPDGPHDAEALMVQPQTGDLYIVTKVPDPGVYVARAPLNAAATTTLTKVTTLALGEDGEFSLITGGDIAPDGGRVAFCTYSGGYELRLPAGATSFDDIWRQTPVPLDLGLRPQGESIAYRLDGKALLTTSERPLGLADPMYQIVQP